MHEELSCQELAAKLQRSPQTVYTPQLSAAAQEHMNFKQIKHDVPVLHIEIFNSTKKRAGVVFKTSDGKVHVHWKGAAEIILDLCSFWMDSDCIVHTLTLEKKDELRKVIEGMAALTLRCIGFAHCLIEELEVPIREEAQANWQTPENDLILLAIAGIKDPCRPGVREAVQKCQRAGVKVRMVTGDNIFTAKAIAQECGILDDKGLVVEGKDFRKDFICLLWV